MAAALVARNRIQKLFLNDEFVGKLCLHVAPLRLHENPGERFVEFEEGDWDILATTGRRRCECDWNAKPENSFCDCRYEKEEESWNEMCCSIQATIGDDYPSVLRKMSKRVKKGLEQAVKERAKEVKEAHSVGERAPPHTPRHFILLVGKLTTEEITHEELSQIFEQKRIKVVFLSELGVEPPP
jgi:hypothetical protein